MIGLKKFLINGGKPLTGTIMVSGAKNSAVALIPAAILCDEPTTIYNVPNISDKNALIDILQTLNVEVKDTNCLKINAQKLKNRLINQDLSSKLRASYYFMGALLGKKGEVKIAFPGGCNFGERKIDLHLKGFESLGAHVILDNGIYHIKAKELKGANIYLDFASVGATINIMLAAVKAEGITKINNAAKEPEIVNVASFLNNMGAKISGAGTSTITIEGVKTLTQAIIEVIPDRIEAGTYLILGALIGKDLIIENIIEQHLTPLISKMQEIGINFERTQKGFKLTAKKNYKPINIKTLPYPGFPTDLAQPMTTLLTQCNGTSLIDETIYANRMGHIAALNQMNANIKIKGQTAIICGKTKLKPCNVKASDLRAGASLVLAALTAKGQSTIENIEYVLRGYSNIIEKLQNVGADIKIIETD